MKAIFCLLAFIILFTLICSNNNINNHTSSKIVTTQLIANMVVYVAQFNVGNPSMGWSRAINQVSDITWISSVVYKNIQSKTLTRLEDKTETNGELHSDIVSFIDDKSFNDFHYFYINNRKSPKPTLGWLGMAFRFKNKDFSLVHQLKKHNFIDHLSYTFSVEEGMMHFGGVPNHVINNKKSGKCKVNPSQTKWSCNLSKVSVGKLRYDNPYESYFQSLEEKILAPKDFIIDYVHSNLKSYIKSKHCFVGDLVTELYIHCNSDIVKSLPDLSFTFDNHTYTLNPKEQYKEYGRLASWSIQYNNDSMSWVFGTIFLRHFDAVFDYEDASVTFYNKDKISLNSIEGDYLRIWIGVCLFSLIIGCIVQLHIKFNLLKASLIVH